MDQQQIFNFEQYPRRSRDESNSGRDFEESNFMLDIRSIIVWNPFESNFMVFA